MKDIKDALYQICIVIALFVEKKVLFTETYDLLTSRRTVDREDGNHELTRLTRSFTPLVFEKDNEGNFTQFYENAGRDKAYAGYIQNARRQLPEAVFYQYIGKHLAIILQSLNPADLAGHSAQIADLLNSVKGLQLSFGAHFTDVQAHGDLSNLLSVQASVINTQAEQLTTQGVLLVALEGRLETAEETLKALGGV